MKKIVLLLLLITAQSLVVSAQIFKPVKWTTDKKSLGNNEYELTFHAKLDNGWYIYSQDNSGEGPIPTTFTFEKKEGVEMKDGMLEERGAIIDKHDPIFDMQVKKFSKEVTFVKKVKASKANAKVAGYLEFMTCDHERCLPPDQVEFSFELPQTSPASSNVGNSPKNNGGNLSSGNDKADNGGWTTNNNQGGTANNNNTTTKNGKANNTNNNNSPTATVTTTPTNSDLANNATATTIGDSAAITTTAATAVDATAAVLNGNLEGLIADCGADASNYKQSGTHSNWWIFLMGFLGGLAALLTPCVFPMIPLTVSFFTKRSKDRASGLRNAIIYALSIIIIYVGLGFLVTKLFGAEMLNIISTDPWVNIGFFVVFVVFALSFFGLYEINLPSSWINQADTASERGGLIGIFFMAFTLALVSFSCTGPIIGTLLVEAAVKGQNIGPLMGMFGFSLALALPFALFAMFPSWLNSLPKSGGWLNVVKVVLGFIELIFALKFLSNADLVKQWGLLPREIFLGIWVLLLGAMTLYLFNVIKFSHDAPIKKLSAGRLTFAALSAIATLYVGSGLFGSDIPLTSGFPPPKFYSLFQHSKTDEKQQHQEGLRDLEVAIAEARKTSKPILVDFTGWACVSCRKMEENVWPLVSDEMKEYTLVSLYVDEKIKLPEAQQFTYELNGETKKVRTVGDKWTYLQIKCFNSNSQPYYVLINDKGELLNKPVGYTPNVQEYQQFLKEGSERFKQGKTLLGQR